MFTGLLLPLAASELPITEPYPKVNSAFDTGRPVLASPDPLVSYEWPVGYNMTGLEIYETPKAVNWTATPESAFSGLSSLGSVSPHVTFTGDAALRLDFGFEHAAWFEFASTDLGGGALSVRAAISEYNEPWQVRAKLRPVSRYADGVYRLQTNDQLYEGVRFVWIFSNATKPWTLTKLRLVAQSKPTNYTGSFDASDEVLSRSWYSGAYGSRLNMMPYGFNSILIERGDRVSIQGDGHPAMAAALAAFGSPTTYDLVWTMLNATNSGFVHGHPVVDSGLKTYPLCWCSSVFDWYWSSGDTVRFLQLAPDVGSIIDRAVAEFLRPNLAVGFVGWDDRVANGFCGSCNMEAQLVQAAFTVRVCVDFAAALAQASHPNASRYERSAHTLAARLRARPAMRQLGAKWYTDYGTHAAAYLIDAKVVATAEEHDALFEQALSDAVTICSWSNFNTYWILQALGNLGRMDYAAAAVKLCWGEILKLGTGCFWEISSPEWAQWMVDGDKAPTSPSYCHPWADGVTHWLTESLAGLAPQQAGFRSFVATPHVSRLHPRVHATRHTPHGPLTLRAELRNITVEIVIDAATDGVIGLRRVEEGSGCALDAASVTLNGRAVAAELMLTDEAPRLHPSVLSRHIFVGVRAVGLGGSTRHVVRASYADGCASSGKWASEMRASVGDTETGRLLSVEPSPTTSLGKGLPTMPPFAAPSYPARWAFEKASGDWLGRRGSSGYVLFAFDGDHKDAQRVPNWIAPPSTWLSPPLATHSKSRWIGADAHNTTYLQDPQGGTRALGWATSSGNYFGADGSQG